MNNPLIFSTLACPDWSVKQTIDLASAFGYDGIEWRGGEQGHINPSSTVAERQALRTGSTDNGLIVHSITAYTSFTSDNLNDQQANIDDLRRYADLAGEIGARYVRAFLGELPAGSQPDSQMIDRIATSLQTAAAYAQTAGVMIVVEPHDDFVRSASAMSILSQVDAPYAGVIWDVGNTWAAGEDYTEGFALLADHLAYVHLKDGRGRSDAWRLCRMGDGEVPLRDILGLLMHAGFGGALCVEWEWAWHRELDPPESALPHAAHIIRSLLAELNSESLQK